MMYKILIAASCIVPVIAFLVGVAYMMGLW
jgi:hypothetical protein